MNEQSKEQKKTETDGCRLNDIYIEKKEREKDEQIPLDPLNIFVGFIDIIKNIFK